MGARDPAACAALWLRADGFAPLGLGALDAPQPSFDRIDALAADGEFSSLKATDIVTDTRTFPTSAMSQTNSFQ